VLWKGVKRGSFVEAVEWLALVVISMPPEVVVVGREAALAVKEVAL
jgi:hypothetical protein